MISKHSKWFTIGFRDSDFNGNLKMNALVDYMQETSNEHASLIGLDFSEGDYEVYWIVSRAKMHLETYPKYKERIRVETYPDGIDKLFAVRRFNIYNEQDDLLGYIIGDYILMDGKTHRPIRLRNMKGILAELEYPYEGETLPKLGKPVSIQKEDMRKVRSGEIDVNAHMNNAHYIRWTTDMIDCEEYKTKQIQSIQTNYVTSLTEGVTAKIVRGLDEEGNTLIQGTSLDESIVYWTSKIVFMNS